MSEATPRVEVIKAGQPCPLLPTAPLLSSRSIQWQGILFEKHHTAALAVPLHEHPTNVLQLQANGPITLEWKQQGRWHQQQMPQHSLILLPQGTQDEVRWHSDLERILISLNQSTVEHAIHEAASGGRVELVELWGFQDQHLLNLMLALQADLSDGSPAGRMFGEALANALIVYLQQRFTAQPIKLKDYRGGLPKYRLNRVLDFIAEYRTSDISLAKLAEIAGISPHYFSQLFRQSTGLTPHQYLLQQRVEYAKKLLHNSNMSIAEIALASGFPDQSHFTKVFRRNVGVTPARYRSQI